MRKVKVSVFSGDDDLKDEVSSYVSRELRSLAGVQTADHDWDFEISLVAIRLPENRPQMIVLSYVFTHVLILDKLPWLQVALQPDMR